MINNVAKLLKNVNSLHQAEIAARHTSHEKNKQIHCFGLLFCQEIRFRKIVEKSEKTHFSKGPEERHTKKKRKITCCVPKSNNAIVTPNPPKAIFRQKIENIFFFKKSL